MENYPTFKFNKTTYQVRYKGEAIQNPQWQLKQLQHCLDENDWVTLHNRINNGLQNGWLVEIGA